MLSRDAIRAFVLRSREEIQELKRDHWTELVHGGDPNASWRAGQALWQHARSVRSDWPSTAEREADLASHLKLRQIFECSAHAFARR